VEWSCKLKTDVSSDWKLRKKLPPDEKLPIQSLHLSNLFLLSYMPLKEQGYRSLSNASKMRKQLFTDES